MKRTTKTLLLFSAIFIFSVYAFYKNYNYINQVEVNKSLNIVEFRSSCEPFKRVYKQYRAEIDGELYPKKVSLYKNASIDFECLNRNPAVKTILLWNKFFDRDDYWFGIGRDAFKQNACPVTNCEITTDKSRIYESHLVITHMQNEIETPPKHRPAAQRWMFMLYESPVHTADFSKYNGFYHFTSTYRLDSDFNTGYDNSVGMRWKENLKFNASWDFYANKTKMAAAVISNCNAQSKRLELIDKLKDNIQVDVYGKCGTFDCEKSYGSNGDCKEMLSYEYKFYLAFENSVCKDYITEKFFDILKYNIVPVVLGGGDYRHHVNYFDI